MLSEQSKRIKAAHKKSWDSMLAVGQQLIQAKEELSAKEFIIVCRRALIKDGVEYYSPQMVATLIDFATSPSDDSYNRMLATLISRLEDYR